MTIAGLTGAATCSGKSSDPKKSQTRAELAKDFLSRHQLATARRECEKAIAFDPKNAEAYNICGLVDVVEAVDNTRLLEVDNCLTGVDAEGLRMEVDEHLRAAEESFARAVTTDPSYSEAWTNRGLVADLQADSARAIEFYEKALDVPHRLQNINVTRANLGWAKFHGGDDVGAAKDLRQALQFKPNMCLAKYRLGRVYFEREEWNKALEQFQAVVETEDCTGMQEAHLYFIRTMSKLSQNTSQVAVQNCTALAPKSCIAAQCQVAR